LAELTGYGFFDTQALLPDGCVVPKEQRRGEKE
jgi:hypothetical protein